MPHPLTNAAVTPSPRVDGTSGTGLPPVVFYNLSDLLGRPVRYEDSARPMGRLYDIGASTQTSYPLSACLDIRVRRGQPHLIIPWSQVKVMTRGETVISRTREAAPAADFWARRDVLDDQVVDVSGAQVLRVNDVHLIYSENKLIFGHVEVGLRGILRRLRFERPVAFLAQWLFDYTLKDSFVTWRHIQVLSPGGIPGGVRVASLSDKLADIHPAELADILEQLGVKDRQVLFNSLSVSAAADTLEEINPEFQRTLVSHGEPGRVADILEEMPPDEAADVLRDLGPDAQNLINQMEDGAAAEVQTLLSHNEETVGGEMDTNGVEAQTEQRVSAVLERLRHLQDDVKVYNLIYVLDDQRLLKGVISLRELLRADPNAKLETIMKDVLVHVAPDTRLKDAAREFAKFGFHALPVLGPGGEFLGIIRYDSVLAHLPEFLKD